MQNIWDQFRNEGFVGDDASLLNQFIELGFVKPWISDGNKVKTMAHVMCDLGFFPSVAQAKKSGWDKPIPLGKIIKHKVHWIALFP